jgi:hypothetical protein
VCSGCCTRILFYLFKYSYFASYLYKIAFINYMAFLLMKQSSSTVSERGGVDGGGSIGQRGGVDSGGSIGQRGGMDCGGGIGHRGCSSYHGSLD